MIAGTGRLRLVAVDALAIVGGYYDLETGAVEILDP
jgi:hypothetical protein